MSAGGTMDTGDIAGPVGKQVTQALGGVEAAAGQAGAAATDASTLAQATTAASGGAGQGEPTPASPGAASLGQGGTSTLASAGKKLGGEAVAGALPNLGSSAASQAPDAVKGIAKTAGTVAGVAGTSQALSVMAMMNWLRLMMVTAQAAAQNVFATAAAWALGQVAAVGGFFAGVGATVGSALGISALVGTIAAMSGALAIGVLVVALVASTLAASATAAQIDGSVAKNCASQPAATAAASAGDATGANAAQLEAAKRTYSVLAGWGMSKANAAGILGNWQAESSVDPTSVQGMTSAGQFQMNEAKLTGAQTLTNGIGLGQWTGGRNQALRDYAQAINKDWWTVDVQLGFLLSAGEGANAGIVKGMISTDQGSPSTAALYFHSAWERSADTAQMAQRRADYAEVWFALESGWAIDTSLANSILIQAGTTLDAANSNEVNTVKSSCQGLSTTDVALKDGGMDMAGAQALIDLYIQEGDAFLDNRYGTAGGPGSCGNNHAENCVSFSTYFMNKYTTFQQYAIGDGKDLAYSLAGMIGKTVSSTPTAYSVGSGPGSSDYGHTLVVLGVNGDQLIVAEAGYCSSVGDVRVASASAMKDLGWVFVDMSDRLLPAGQVKTS